MYNIETAMPVIDLDAIENHLKTAREEERRVSEILNIQYLYSNKIATIVLLGDKMSTFLHTFKNTIPTKYCMQTYRLQKTLLEKH